ncbi:MAG: hypothetical protein JWR07_5090 [Nevskia sp.]|nr:hypothetical protein [Nevskia sp.]
MAKFTGQSSKYNPDNPESEILGPKGLALFLGVSEATILNRRSRSPERCPPAFCDHPLRWRRGVVLTWQEQRECEERARAERHVASVSPSNRRQVG